MKRLWPVIGALALAASAAAGAGGGRPALPPVRHVFVLVLENEDAAAAFGPGSPARYLAKTLKARGAFLPAYHGITHASLGNYVALISGQGPSPATRSDCHVYTDFAATGTGANGQVLGDGCVYPRTVRTLAGQLTAAGLRWKGYMEDMGNNPAREPARCGAPTVGAIDRTQQATVGDQYAARHNPFVYFHAMVDSPLCRHNVVPLGRLASDLRRVATTANVTFITPNLCHDGHDSPCVDGRPGGLVSADAFLRAWVPRITSSPAFRRDGMLLVTFDEAENDASACCRQAPYPNVAGDRSGGGRVGAVVLSRYVRAGTSTNRAYNHFSTLRTIEALFGLPYLGYAASPDPGRFGADVFTG